MRIIDAVRFSKSLLRAWSEDRASRLAAALAFYTAFALAPLLIIVIQLAALALGGAGHHHVVRSEILGALRPSLGISATNGLALLVQATFDQRSQGTLAAIVSWVLFIAAATGLFAAVEDALNTIWHVEDQNSDLRAMLRDRLVSFAIIAGVAFVLLLSLFVNAGITALSSSLALAIPTITWAAVAIDVVVSLVTITLLFAVVYTYLPKAKVRFRDALAGAAVTAVAFMVGQYVIGWYLGRAATTSAYGAAGSFAALLLWVYYSGQIFLFGAEITKALAPRAAVYVRRGTLPPTTSRTQTSQSSPLRSR